MGEKTPAHTFNSRTSVHIYTRAKRTQDWTPKQTLQPTGLVTYDFYGTEVAMSDDAQFLVVGAMMNTYMGQAWVYKLNKADSTYAEIQMLTDPDAKAFGRESMAFSPE